MGGVPYLTQGGVPSSAPSLPKTTVTSVLFGYWHSSDVRTTRSVVRECVNSKSCVCNYQQAARPPRDTTCTITTSELLGIDPGIRHFWLQNLELTFTTYSARPEQQICRNSKGRALNPSTDPRVRCININACMQPHTLST
jgi:hypothetical protein